VLDQLRAERSFNQGLLELLEKPVLPGQVLRLLVVRKQLSSSSGAIADFVVI
jgi:hypothetical protein